MIKTFCQYNLIRILSSFLINVLVLSRRWLMNLPKLSRCNVMAKGFRFMPLSLVRLKTFRLSTWVS